MFFEVDTCYLCNNEIRGQQSQGLSVCSQCNNRKMIVQKRDQMKKSLTVRIDESADSLISTRGVSQADITKFQLCMDQIREHVDSFEQECLSIALADGNQTGYTKSLSQLIVGAFFSFAIYLILIYSELF